MPDSRSHMISRREMLRIGSLSGVALASGDSSRARSLEDLAIKPVRLPKFPSKPSPDTTKKLFSGFTRTEIQTAGAIIPVLHKGWGPPLLLLHGFPETHVAWHKLAGQLSEMFSVYIPDLRGYGDSSRPPDGDRHFNHSFRAMALDQVETMRHFGHSRFYVGGHDRGARVAHRLCLDFPEAVSKVCLMDIAPTLTMYRETNQEFATKYMWWFFLIQEAPVPEHLIGLDPEFYLHENLAILSKTPGAISKDVLDEYRRCFCCTSTIHAVCEDYRAAAGIDLEMDEEDERAGRKVTVPIHALWGSKGTVGQLWDVLSVWREKSSSTVTGRELECGHLLPEERPQEVLQEMQRFFGKD